MEKTKTVEITYQSCSVCGAYADDGGLRQEKYFCHDCLDNEISTAKCDFEKD